MPPSTSPKNKPRLRYLACRLRYRIPPYTPAASRIGRLILTVSPLLETRLQRRSTNVASAFRPQPPPSRPSQHGPSRPAIRRGCLSAVALPALSWALHGMNCRLLPQFLTHPSGRADDCFSRCKMTCVMSLQNTLGQRTAACMLRIDHSVLIPSLIPTSTFAASLSAPSPSFLPSGGTPAGKCPTLSPSPPPASCSSRLLCHGRLRSNSPCGARVWRHWGDFCLWVLFCLNFRQFCRLFKPPPWQWRLLSTTYPQRNLKPGFSFEHYGVWSRNA